jgi:hypothetical protein
MTGFRTFVAVCGIALLLLLSAAAETPGRARIVELGGERDGSLLLLSFQLEGAFDQRMEERIQSGLPTTLRYDARLEHRRKWWLNNTVDSGKLEIVAMYKAITREYLVNFRQDGRLVESQVVKSAQELRDTMTIVHRRALLEIPDLQAGRLVVKVRAELGSKNLLGILPTTDHTSWAEWSPPATRESLVVADP